MKFQSEYFETADDLVRAKDDAWLNVSDRRKRLKTVRQFVNMMNTLTEAEAEKLGRTEITNHGLTHRDMLQNETQFTSMVTVTNSLVEVIVDTDNPEKDTVMGLRISEAINRGAVHFKGRFANFWRKVAGEIVIAGGCPVTQNEKYGWLPKLRPDMFFPKETSLDAEEITFAFDPVELTISDLEALSAAVKGDESKYIDKQNIDALIEKIKEQIANNTKDAGSSFEIEVSHSTRDRGRTERSITVSAWWYYEVKLKKGESGDQYVSATLFIDGVSGITLKGDKGMAAKVVVYVDKAFDNASDWLHMVHVDSEIGGVKNVDTLKGVAEMIYPSGLEMEELLNLIMEGDKIRARPKIRLMDNADADAVAKWDVVADLYAPAGVEEMEFKGNTRGLQTPFALLNQNVSGMSGGAVANGPQGGELRQQAVERQQNSAMLQTNRVSEAYNHLDSILESVVWRLLAGPVKPGCAGYREIMFVRAMLDKYEIPYKDLAKRKFGRFEYLRVRSRRSIGNGDRTQQIETSDWLMANIQNYEPAARPMVIHKATVLRTQDPDEADSLVKIPKAIINAQKITAENEFDTIARRASLGQVMPVAQDDIHQDHIPIHMLDMQAMVARHAVRPWDKLDVITFAGVVEHTGMHLKILMGNPVTAGEAKMFLQDYQNITQAAQAIVQEVEEAEGQKGQQEGLDPATRMKFELESEKLRQSGIKLGLAVAEADKLDQNRNERSDLAKRAQYTREINEDRRLKLDAARIKVQAESAKQKPKTEK